MKSKLPNLMTLIASCVLTVLALEGSLRVYYFGSLFPFIGGPKLYQPDREIGFRLAPDLQSSQQRPAFIVPVTTNSMGLRGPEIGPKSDAFRIAILGDSHIFGSGLADDETLPNRLQMALKSTTAGNSIEVINLGHPAHNTVQELLILRRLIGQIEPDLVIFAFTGENDIQYNTEGLRRLMTGNPRRPVASLTSDGQLVIDHGGAEHYYRQHKWRLDGPPRERAWYENTALYLRGRITWKSLTRKGLEDPNVGFGWPYLSRYSKQYSSFGASEDSYRKLWQEGWSVTKALILEIQRTAAGHGATFAMVSMPSEAQVQTNYIERVLVRFPDLKFDLLRINRYLNEFGKQHGIPVLELLRPLLAARDAGVTGLHYTVYDSHMTPKAHEILARALADELVAKGLLPNKLAKRAGIAVSKVERPRASR